MGIKIVRIPIPPPSNGEFTSLSSNTYIIGNQKETVLIDAGFNDQLTKDAINNAIDENDFAIPGRIILTHAHPDHAPGVHQFSDWPVIVYCHVQEEKAVKKAIPYKVPIKQLNDNDTIFIDNAELKIIHSPGHTPGHISIYIPSEKILIAGDNIVAEGTTWVGAPDGDMLDYIQTLKKLNELHIKKIGPGHGDWVLKPHEQINFVIERRLHRENQIISLLQEHTQLTSTELTNLIYQDTIHPKVVEFAKRTIEAHLLKLIKENIVKEENASFSLKY